MKVLKLHPLMTISLLQMQFQRLLCCNVTVYVHNSLANAFVTLREAGFPEDMLVEYPIDETLSLREFEEELEEKFNFSLELCSKKDNKPFTNKSLHLFQLITASQEHGNGAREETGRQFDLSLEMLLKRQAPPGFSF